MVWGSICGSGKGDLWFMPPNTTINTNVYLGILQEKLKQSMATLNCHTFQQDGAPCHKAKIVHQWLRSEHIDLLDWPGQSPDLNPIENAWMIIKRGVSSAEQRSLNHLKEIIVAVLQEKFTVAECDK